MNYTLEANEAVLYEGYVTSKDYKGSIYITLTSQKLVIEKESGVFKKVREIQDCIELTDVKIYNDTAQVKQKMSDVEIQTVAKNITITFSGMIEARKFTGKLIDTVTGTTLAQRVSDKTKAGFEMVDDTLGLDTRGTIKGVLEKGTKGTLINGIGKKTK
jgi:hypothetical protein